MWGNLLAPRAVNPSTTIITITMEAVTKKWLFGGSDVANALPFMDGLRAVLDDSPRSSPRLSKQLQERCEQACNSQQFTMPILILNARQQRSATR